MGCYCVKCIRIRLIYFHLLKLYTLSTIILYFKENKLERDFDISKEYNDLT